MRSPPGPWSTFLLSLNLVLKKTKMNLAFLGKLGGFIAAAIFIYII
jgi:hypothetical protein